MHYFKLKILLKEQITKISEKRGLNISNSLNNKYNSLSSKNINYKNNTITEDSKDNIILKAKFF